MKFKFRNLLIGTGIAVLGLAAAGAAVGISEKKADKPDTSDTMTENLDLINLIGDLQSQINSVNTENEQIKSQLNSVKNENNILKNQLNSIFDSNIEVNGNITATEGYFNSIQVGETEFTESDLDKHLYKHSLYMNFYPGSNEGVYLQFDFYSTQSESLSNDFDFSIHNKDVNYFIDKLKILYSMNGSVPTYFINYYSDDASTASNGYNFTPLYFNLYSTGFSLRSIVNNNFNEGYISHTFDDLSQNSFSLDSFDDIVVQIF